MALTELEQNLIESMQASLQAQDEIIKDLHVQMSKLSKHVHELTDVYNKLHRHFFGELESGS